MAMAREAAPLAPDGIGTAAALAAALQRLSAARTRCFSAHLVLHEAGDLLLDGGAGGGGGGGGGGVGRGADTALTEDDCAALRGALQTADAAQRLRFSGRKEEEEEEERDLAGPSDGSGTRSGALTRHVLGVDPSAFRASAAARGVPARVTPAVRAEIAARLADRVDSLALLLLPGDGGASRPDTRSLHRLNALHQFPSHRAQLLAPAIISITTAVVLSLGPVSPPAKPIKLPPLQSVPRTRLT